MNFYVTILCKNQDHLIFIIIYYAWKNIIGIINLTESCEKCGINKIYKYKRGKKENFHLVN